MKKFFAILLAMMLVLSMSAVAMAATPTTEATFNFNKTYQNAAGETAATYPAEKLGFTVAPAANNPDTTTITIEDQTVNANPDQILIGVPSYDKVGTWNYTVSEVKGNTKGVTYYDNSFNVRVVVTYAEADGKVDYDTLVASTHITSRVNDIKVTGIVNRYDLGTLTVDKNVTGNLASQTQKFDIDVVFTSDKPVLSAIQGVTGWTLDDGVYTSNTVTVHLAHGDSVATIANIPAGVSYKVVEQAKHEAADANGSNPATGYTVSYTGDEGTIAADGTSAAVVTNQKGTTVDTGITTDSLPYIMLIGLVVISGVIMLINRRKACND